MNELQPGHELDTLAALQAKLDYAEAQLSEANKKIERLKGVLNVL